MEPAFLPDQIDAHRLLVQVGAGRTTDDFEDNQAIFAQGDDANFVFFVQDGSVKLTRVLADGSEKIIGIAQQGQFFGEACLHDVPSRLASANAMGRCRIASVTKEVMLTTIQRQPKLAKMFVDYLSDHNSWVKKELLGHLLKPKAAA
jgi:CRP/FNR family cyclic AMP-dependent transcriptional regulator